MGDIRNSYSALFCFVSRIIYLQSLRVCRKT